MELFALKGPQFLIAYTTIGLLVVAWLVWRRRACEAGPVPRLPYSDPYLVAYLRDGKEAARRVALLSLIDRELLTPTETSAKGVQLVASGPTAPMLVKRPLERAILERCKTPQLAARVIEDPSLDHIDRAYEIQLQHLGLLPNAAVRSQRTMRALAAVGVVVGVAGFKIFLALKQGHTNVFFLIILALGFLAACGLASHPARTVRGDRVLESLKTLFGRLKARAGSLRPGKSPDEVALITAVFGAGILPNTLFPHAQHLSATPSRGGGGGSTGHHCSSSGSSCGGCGGGCGGCGGD